MRGHRGPRSDSNSRRAVGYLVVEEVALDVLPAAQTLLGGPQPLDAGQPKLLLKLLIGRPAEAEGQWAGRECAWEPGEGADCDERGRRPAQNCDALLKLIVQQGRRRRGCARRGGAPHAGGQQCSWLALPVAALQGLCHVYRHTQPSRRLHHSPVSRLPTLLPHLNPQAANSRCASLV